MGSNVPIAAICGFFSWIAFAQTGPSQNILEHFVAKPSARVTWSGEMAKIDTEQAHAVITALVVEDATQEPAKIRGVKIDLTGAAGKDQVYSSEDGLGQMAAALDEITSWAPRVLTKPGARNARCFGSKTWPQSEHMFSASQCIFPDWSGLVVSTGTQFRFAGIDASQFRPGVIRARFELRGR